MIAGFDTVRLALLDLPGYAVVECFPRAQTSAMTQQSVGATNHSNVSFCCQVKDISVTSASADTVLDTLRWRLNASRVAVIGQARRRSESLFAKLEDDVLRQVCDFVAIQPQR